MISKTHFHIRWSTAALLDWQSFHTRDEAEHIAKELAHPHETYTIEEMLDESCQRCGMLRGRRPREGKVELDFDALQQNESSPVER